VSPEQGQSLKWLADGCAQTGRHGASVGARAWHLGCLILAAGRGFIPLRRSRPEAPPTRQVSRPWPPAPAHAC
jgi:hypothetical protein